MSSICDMEHSRWGTKCGGCTGHDPIPVDVENVMFFKENYEIVVVPAYEAPPQDEYPKRSLRIVDETLSAEEVDRIWGRYAVDDRGDIWRVVGYSHNNLEDNDYKVKGLVLSVEKWYPEYYYETIRCGICHGRGTQVSRNENDTCPLVGWATDKEGKEVHRHCLTPHVPAKAITTEDGGIHLDMSGTMASLKLFHQEAKAYADWFGFLDPNPVKWGD